MKQGYCQDSWPSGPSPASGTLGILIPPSIMLVIMADQLGLSVGDLFMGAVIPGLILGVLYIALYSCTVRLSARQGAPCPKTAGPFHFE